MLEADFRGKNTSLCLDLQSLRNLWDMGGGSQTCGSWRPSEG